MPISEPPKPTDGNTNSNHHYCRPAPGMPPLPPTSVWMLPTSLWTLLTDPDVIDGRRGTTIVEPTS
jgi:hypothetical protein